MEKSEKILELLEKESASGLTSEEKTILQDLIASDAESKIIADTYRNLNKSFNSFHPDAEIIASYVLVEKGERVENNIAQLLSEKIKKHLSECSKCNEEYESLKAEFEETHRFVHERISIERPAAKTKIFPLFTTIPALRYAVAALLLFGFVYAGLFTVSSITTPQYVKEFFTDDNEFYVTRGRTSLLFQKGLDAIENKKWDAAIQYMTEDISMHSSEVSIFYTHYVLGLTYLQSSGSDFLGLFKSFNKDRIQLAVDNFRLALEKNTSGNFQNVNLDTHYYLGKSYVLLNDHNNAAKHLKIVISNKGRFYKNAEKLLSSIKEQTMEKN